MIFLGPVIIILLFFLIFIISKHVTESRTPQNFPPGPRPLPIIGNLHMLDLKRPQKTFIELSKKYGSVFSFELGPRKVVVLLGYEAVKEALVDHADVFAERPDIPIFKKYLKNMGVVFSHGENWKVMRRFTLTTLRDFGMGKRTLEDKIIEECSFLLKSFESQKGNPFMSKTIISTAVSNIIVSILFGQRFDYQDPLFLRLINLLSENVVLLGSPSIMVYNIYPALGFLLAGYRSVKKNRNEFRSFIAKTLIQHLKQLDSNDQRSLIDVFLVRQEAEKSNPNSFFHDDNLISLANNLFAAGTETSATTLYWGLLLMMKYPEVQRKVQEEIETVMGSSQPKTEYRKIMPYTDAVIHEIQRYANILPLSVHRETTSEIKFKGYLIPKGTYIIPVLESVLYDKSQFEKPTEFNPQHFLNSEGSFIKKEAFMPFGAGRRICAGETLAKMELFLFFVSLLQRFTFRPPPDLTDFDFKTLTGITISPQPYKICALPRS
ncbi:cytochrome P450 2K6-like [Rhinatrema bivittatum]|uniref:cytochrome P450 2K6-like n=1 Tax=Rhinatrema bivittatum TaxID=194408 RepID=UPI001125F4F8|nr:cytochrome P450 2K6-like [Rhinatrema bivittatum]